MANLLRYLALPLLCASFPYRSPGSLGSHSCPKPLFQVRFMKNPCKGEAAADDNGDDKITNIVDAC